MDQNRQLINPSRTRTKVNLNPKWVGVERPDPLFPGKLLTCQQILSMDSQTSELG